MSRKDKKNKILQVVMIVISFMLFMSNSYVFAASINVEEQTSNFYVNDFANLFTDEQEQEMMQKAIELDKSYNGIQVVLTTINSLKGYSSQEYAYSMYNQYGIGKDSMGILILFAVEDRQVRIETGYNMQSYITDSISGKILDKYGMDYFRNNQFSEGLINVQNATIDEIKNRVPFDWNEKNQSINNSIDFDFSGFMLKVLLFIIFPVGILLLFVLLIKKIIQRRKDKQQKIINEAIQENNKKWEEKVENINAIFEVEKQNLNTKVNNKDGEIERLTNLNSRLDNSLKRMEEREEYVKKIHPNIDEEIEAKKEEEYKEKAQAYDSVHMPLLDIKPSRKNEAIFENGIEAYEKLPSEVRKYSKMDINMLKHNHDISTQLRRKHEEDEAIKKDIKLSHEAFEKIKSLVDSSPKPDHNNYLKIAAIFALYMGLSKAQKSYIKDDKTINSLLKLNEASKIDYDNYTTAKNVEKSLNSTIRRIGRPDRYDIIKLKSAISKYNNLTTAQKAYISIEIYNKLKIMLSNAEDEEEEYKRRKRHEEESRRSSFNISSSSGFSGFSGHGGRSGGGGAGRSF